MIFHFLGSFFGSIRRKLIGIFILIKVIPLVALALFAWYAAVHLSAEVTERSNLMADSMLRSIEEVGESVIEDSTIALDARSREAIERLTTDTAHAIALFLRERDKDILLAAQLATSTTYFKTFLENRTRPLYQHEEWLLSDDQSQWLPLKQEGDSWLTDEVSELEANARGFNHRQKESLGTQIESPLYREMTLIGLDGKEKIKIGDLTDDGLQDVSNRLNTFSNAETYWPELQQLQPGEIYVSEVIGSYVGSNLIGLYNPENAEAAGLEFEPELSAYAGVENPVGKRFEGIIRWATPLVRGGNITGYITLALNHDHLRQFTDRIVPTEQRYTPISNASEGNYAFLWDYKNRAISHPRDYFIHGYNSETGLPETPWMDSTLYDEWQQSELTSQEFLADVVEFDQPSLDKKPSAELVKQGTIALDCRYLNFSPQCQGWDQLTRDGGSGSFVIFFSGLWKLTTAATIPYYTGRYGRSDKGFGFVTIGANVDEFHQAAIESKHRITGIIDSQIDNYTQQQESLLGEIKRQLAQATSGLISSTLFLVLIVVAIAFWMAGALTRRITTINEGLQRFHRGDYKKRLQVKSQDEMGQLATAFNGMADSVSSAIKDLRHEVVVRREKEDQLRIAAVAYETQQGMCITDADNRILSVNRAYSEITGYDENEAVGNTPGMLRSGEHTDTFEQEIWEKVREKGQWRGELVCKRKSGVLFPAWVTITQVANEQGDVTHYVRALTDISDRKSAEKHIKQLAYYDSLTKLPNRQMLSDRLEASMLELTHSRKGGALIFIDLDNFKALNDTAGHHHGDLLLGQVAERLAVFNQGDDIVARFGGDEFVILLSNLATDLQLAQAEIKRVTSKIVTDLGRPYKFIGFEHRITASVGVTLFSVLSGRGSDSIDQLLQQADLAMYEAKSSGRNQVCFFSPELQAAANSRAELESDLHEAILDDQFELYYQPQVNQRGVMQGVEALIRWNHPVKGLISPLDFIPVAEETGQIEAIGLWVIEQACIQLGKWQHAVAGDFTVSVNVSSKQFQSKHFVREVVDIIARQEINPAQLKMELTESVLSENVDTIVEKMWVLRNLGVGFALDDFGTGYSSLSYLKKLPLNYLKIDKSFVQDLAVSASDEAIAKTIVGLSRNLGLEVIAEGVETKEQLKRLASFGCNLYQGYYFSKPVPSSELVLPVRAEVLQLQMAA